MPLSLPDGLTHEHVLNMIRDGETAHQSRVAAYDRCYEVYTAAPPRGVKKMPWESQLRIRYGQQTIDTGLVNIVGGPPRAKVKPRRPQDTDTAPKMQTVLDYHVAEDHLAEKWALFVWQGLVYPLTAAKNHWLYKETEQVSRQFFHNPSNPAYPIPVEKSERVVLRDGPTFEPWDIYDLWWEPMARDVDSAAYIVLRSWVTKEELLQRAKSEANPFGLYDQAAVLELLKKEPTGVAGERLSAQERNKRGTESKRKGRYELLEVWRDDSFAVLGNRSVILQHDRNPYNHGQKPIVIAQTRLDGFEMTGFSDTELLDPLQDALNSLLNMRIDNLHMTVQRGFTYRESGVLDPRSLVVKPRFMWGVTDHDDIRPVDMPSLPAEAYKEDDVLLGRMQHITGINSFVSGSASVGVDQNTATGVTALTEISSRLLRFKARMLAYKGLQRSFEQWGEMIQQFMDSETAIRIEGPDGYNWDTVSPQEIAGNYDYSVEGTEESLSRQQEQANAIGLLNALAPFLNAGFVNWQPVLEKVAKTFDFEPTVIFRPQPQPPPAAPTGPTGPAQTTPDPMAANGQSYSPAVQQSIVSGQG